MGVGARKLTVASLLANALLALLVVFLLMRQEPRRIANIETTAVPTASSPVSASPAVHTPGPDNSANRWLGEKSPANEVALMLDLTCPATLTAPMDIAPDDSVDAPDARICLRIRQGANEVIQPGGGRADFPFQLAADGSFALGVRCRWTSDGVGSVLCNNSLFVRIDGRLYVLSGESDGNPTWHWEITPTVRLAAGLHWLSIESREDGVVADRAALLPASHSFSPHALDAVQPTRLFGVAGRGPSDDPQGRMGSATFLLAQTGSWVIGKGQVNDVTVVSRLDDPAVSFRGTVKFTTAEGGKSLAVRDIALTAAQPFDRQVVTLDMASVAGDHDVVVIAEVLDAQGLLVHREELRFLRGYEWAFAAAPPGRGGVPVARDWLAKLASRKPDAVSGKWIVVTDRSCYDWSGAVDLGRVFRNAPATAAVAVTFIGADTHLDHRSFIFQCDDRGWLAVNGEQVVALPVDLPREANRLWTSARLNAGRNAVVAYVEQRSAYWGFRFEVINWHWQGRRGDVIRALKEEGN